MTDEQTAIIAFLSRPESYGLSGGAIERHETHGSIVFLAGERAYKLKRSVRLPYMDYSSAARRKAMCEAELAVNQRLAPELYLAVVPVLGTKGRGFRLGAPGEAQEAADWLVAMRRFDQASLFEQLRRSGALTTTLMRALAERLACFHGAAEPRKDFGGAEGIAAVVAENAELLGALAGRPFDPAKLARLDGLVRKALAERAPRLEARRADGRVRRCHGDLHLNNICLWQGRPLPFDAIEFNDDFACIDVLFDLALLVMDLDRHGLRAHANALLNRYLECAGDYGGLAVLPLFLSCRAAMRAHVVVAMAERSTAGLDRTRAEEARHLLDCAIAYLEAEPPKAVAVGGLSGTGKSSLAARLAPALGRAPGALVLRSDVIRKSLAGVALDAHLPPESYTAEASLRVYAEMERRFALCLEAGYSAIADAVFGKSEERAQIATAARRRDIVLQGLWLAAPAQTLAKRLEKRRGDASDATAAVLEAQLRWVEPPADWARIDAGGGEDTAVAQALRALGAQ